MHEMHRNRQINGGDDDTDDCSPDEPCPTRRKVLVAVSWPFQSSRSILTLNLIEFFLELDGLLDSFKYNLHIEQSKSMQPTHITSYFTRPTS